jgi:SAM-dependent methyltransferase
MSVLDVGCGTGAITKGIAEAVGPSGTVVGVDRDESLLERAKAHGALLPNLRFEIGDATRLPFDACFDIVTAARTLQWIADVGVAIRQMARAAKPGGRLVVLDYNHSQNDWEPAPPTEFMTFYSAFLSWRASNGWDNEVANHLPALFEDAGLREIQTYIQDETSAKGDPDFYTNTSLWVEVIDNLGPALVNAQVCDAPQLDAARRSYDAWRTTGLVRHRLAMKTTVARVAAGR